MLVGGICQKFKIAIKNHTDRDFRILVEDDPEGSVAMGGAGLKLVPHGGGGALNVTSRRSTLPRVQDLWVLAGASEQIVMNSERPSLTIGFWVPELGKYRVVYMNRAFDHMQDLQLVPEHLNVPENDHTSLLQAWKDYHDMTDSTASPISSRSSVSSHETRTLFFEAIGSESECCSEPSPNGASHADAEHVITWSIVD